MQIVYLKMIIPHWIAGLSLDEPHMWMVKCKSEKKVCLHSQRVFEKVVGSKFGLNYVVKIVKASIMIRENIF